MISTSTPKSSSLPRISIDAPARVLRRRRQVGDFDIDDQALEILPIRFASDFFANHPMLGVFCARFRFGAGGFCLWGFHPLGMMISCAIFWSKGVT